mgnify:CR=1 FL=1
MTGMRLVLYLAIGASYGLAAEDGAKIFAARCSACHGADGLGGERGPRIASDRGDLARILREGTSQMPPVAVNEAELAAITPFVKAVIERAARTPVTPKEAKKSVGPYRDWPTYNGEMSGNRHSPLKQIHTGNVSQLAPRWMYLITSPGLHEGTPVVSEGVLYLSIVNEIHALDPRDGRVLWTHRRPRTRALAGDAAAGINRGVALDASRVFFVTDNAKLVAADRATGKILWETLMAPEGANYGATSAPLVVEDVVIAGVSGGDEGVRGFLDGYRASTGERVWRFWTAPAPGEPFSETWRGRDIEHGCAAAWFTGTYDPGTELVYWPTGNPCPDYDGAEREGDNLFSNSVLALDPKTGERKWHFQFTPHDLHDWDATQTPVLADMNFRGRPRKLLLQANRNGYFYVLDRVTGEFLQATPFVKKLTWADGIDEKGRPRVREDSKPTAEGVRVCPAVEGATNWYSPAWHPGTGLFYAQTLEKCSIFARQPETWEAGKSFYGGSTRRVPNEPGQKILRAIEPETGRIVWEHPQAGAARSWGGVLSTDGGLVFFGEDNGSFSAADASTGKVLWRFPMNVNWKASPMTYMIDGRQYVAIQAGPALMVFGLPESGSAAGAKTPQKR